MYAFHKHAGEGTWRGDKNADGFGVDLPVSQSARAGADRFNFGPGQQALRHNDLSSNKMLQNVAVTVKKPIEPAQPSKPDTGLPACPPVVVPCSPVNLLTCLLVHLLTC